MAHTGLVWRFLKLCAVAAGLALLATCGGGMIDTHACDSPPAVGTWDVSLDYGGGKTIMQRWTISRDYCQLAIVAEPRDEYTPDWALVDPGVGFWGTPINTIGPCDYHLNLIVTLVGDSFKGTIDWRRISNSTGQCALANGRIIVTALRR